MLKSTAAFIFAALVAAAPLRAESEALVPLWANAPTQSAEPVLLIRHDAASHPSATLLFAPTKLLRVGLANGEATYSPSDFVIHGRRIEYVGRQAVPGFDEQDLVVPTKTPHSIGNYKDGKAFLLFSEGHYMHDRQLVVDYTTEEKWIGPVPSRQSLPALERAIAAGRPIAVTLLGDSISTGANASSKINAAPHQPAFFDFFVARLRAAAKGEVKFANFSVGGKTSAWGLTQVDQVIASKPDLVIIAFGMNDSSGRVPAEKFRSTTVATMDAIRSARPAVEFILISGMSANPEWNKANVDFHVAEGRELAALAQPGVALCDVRSVWDHVVERKGFLSLTGNGVNHPNDFGHRIYAECLISTVWGATER